MGRDPLIPATKLYVDTSSIEGAGRGVFTFSHIKAGEVLEECHYVHMVETNFKAIDKMLQTYVFYNRKLKINCAVLGFGMIYNTSEDPSVCWEIDTIKDVFRYRALRDIEAGSELLINYGYIPEIR